MLDSHLSWPLAFQEVFWRPGERHLSSPVSLVSFLQYRGSNTLVSGPAAQPALPAPAAAAAAAANEGLDLNNIQGDILCVSMPFPLYVFTDTLCFCRIGMKKKNVLYFFFSVKKVSEFKRRLKDKILPSITSTMQLLDVNQQPATALNVAFSQSGLTTLGVNDSLGQDTSFSDGQFKNAPGLGDQ